MPTSGPDTSGAGGARAPASGAKDRTALPERTPRTRRSSHRWLAAVITAVVAVAAVLFAAGRSEPRSADAEEPIRPNVIGSLPVWNLAGGTSTITAHADSFTAASPSLYEVAPTGELALRQQPAGVVAPAQLDALRRQGVAIVPTISNTRNGSWDPLLIQTILHDPALVTGHIEAIVDLVSEQGFAGVDIDYEELAAADREVFTDFIERLADAMHREDRTLTVDVFAKDSHAGYDQRNLAQDYAALGAAADEVRLMAYDWHWQTSDAGPIAPVDWVDRVLTYAVHEIPAHKIALGIPTYGYGWGPVSAELVSWLQAYALSEAHGVPVQWDHAGQSPWLTYVDEQGAEQTVWFENAYSIKAKLQLAQSYRIGGVFLWLVGDEDDGLWPIVSAYSRGRPMEEVGGP
jgi:spore germination protein